MGTHVTMIIEANRMSRAIPKDLSLKLIVLGYDSGGRNKNGAAIIKVFKDNRMSAEVKTTSSVDETFNWFIENVGDKTKVEAVGIDTLLSWATVESGWRPMDKWIKDWLLNKGKKETEETRRSILSSNFLQGAMVVQAMAMAKKLRDDRENIILNETHPKVQYWAITKKSYKFKEERESWLKQQESWDIFPEKLDENDDQWDALFSAWVTLKAISSESTLDLVDNPEAKTLIFPVGKVNYYWPFE